MRRGKEEREGRRRGREGGRGGKEGREERKGRREKRESNNTVVWLLLLARNIACCVPSGGPPTWNPISHENCGIVRIFDQ